MIRGLYTAATGMLVENMRTDVLANNLANHNTTGFKRDIGIFKALPEKQIRRTNDSGIPTLPVAKAIPHIESERELFNLNFRKPPIIGKMGYGAILDEVWTDFEPGLLASTDRNLDSATGKNNFFLVETAGGKVQMTKNGSFNVDSEGFLVTSSGEFVLGFDSPESKAQGEVVFDDTGTLKQQLSRIKAGQQDAFFMDGQGRIFPNGGPALQRLARVEVKDPRQVEKVGDNLFSHKMGEIKLDIESGLEVGYLEKANFSLVSEMVEMITASRAYESQARAIQSHDSLLDKAVNSLGRVG